MSGYFISFGTVNVLTQVFFYLSQYHYIIVYIVLSGVVYLLKSFALVIFAIIGLNYLHVTLTKIIVIYLFIFSLLKFTHANTNITFVDTFE